RLSLRFLDAIHKQAQVSGGGRVRQHPGRGKISSRLGISVDIFEHNSAGNFHDAIGAHAARNLYAFGRSFRSHVVEPYGFRACAESFDQFAFVPHFNLYRWRRRPHSFGVQAGCILEAMTSIFRSNVRNTFSTSGNPAQTSVWRARRYARATVLGGVVAAVLASPGPMSSANAFRTTFSICSECQFTSVGSRPPDSLLQGLSVSSAIFPAQFFVA